MVDILLLENCNSFRGVSVMQPLDRTSVKTYFAVSSSYDRYISRSTTTVVSTACIERLILCILILRGKYRLAVVLNLIFATPPLSTCPLFQAPLALNKL